MVFSLRQSNKDYFLPNTNIRAIDNFDSDICPIYKTKIWLLFLISFWCLCHFFK